MAYISIDYVYFLMIDDLVVYIGRTDWPTRRYKEHCTDGSSKAYYIARYLYSTGRILRMEIIHGYKHRQGAGWMEEEYIKAYRKTNFLLNDDTWHNSPFSHAVPRFKTILNRHLYLEEIKRIHTQTQQIKEIALNIV